MKGVISLGRGMKLLQKVKRSCYFFRSRGVLREVVTLLDRKHNFKQGLRYFSTEQKGHLGEKIKQHQAKKKKTETKLDEKRIDHKHQRISTKKGSDCSLSREQNLIDFGEKKRRKRRENETHSKRMPGINR